MSIFKETQPTPTRVQGEPQMSESLQGMLKCIASCPRSSPAEQRGESQKGPRDVLCVVLIISW